MDRRKFLQGSLLSVAVAAAPESSLFADAPVSTPTPQARPSKEQVDFDYAFAPPHRMTIARPEASEKTLLDLETGVLTMSWSYEDLRRTPLAILKLPPTDWHVKMQPLLDGKPFLHSTWKRGEDILPILDNLYRDAAGTIELEAIGGVTGALVRVTAHNSDTVAHRFSVVSEVLNGWVMSNPAWVDPAENPDALLACHARTTARIECCFSAWEPTSFRWAE